MQRLILLFILTLKTFRICSGQSEEKAVLISEMILEFKLKYPLILTKDSEFIRKSTSPAFPYYNIHQSCYQIFLDLPTKMSDKELLSYRSSNVILDADSFSELSISNFLGEFKNLNIVKPWFVVHEANLSDINSLRVDQRVFFINYDWNVDERYQLEDEQKLITIENSFGKINNGLKFQNEVLGKFLERRGDFKGTHFIGLTDIQPPYTGAKELIPFSENYIHRSRPLVFFFNK